MVKLSLSNWPNLIEKAIALVSRVFNNIGMVVLMLLMLVITADVLLRATLSRPIYGANEIAEFMMILVVFLAVAYTQHIKGHIAVDLLHSRFPKRMQAIVDSFVYLLCLGICSLMVRQAIVYQNELWEANRISDILKVPVAPFALVMFIGFVMFALVFLLDLIHSLRKAAKT